MAHLGRKSVLRTHRILIRLVCGAQLTSQAALISKRPRRLQLTVPSFVRILFTPRLGGVL